MMYARHKFNETKYFFELLVQQPPGAPIYQYLFSAFITSFRSITFAIQSDYKHAQNFENEYSKLREALEQIPLSKELVEARNITLKEGAKIPVLVITSVNNETGDTIKIERDPLAIDADGVQKTIFTPAFRQEWSYPSLEELKKNHFLNMAKAMELMDKSQSVSTSYTLRLTPDGIELSHEEFHNLISRLLEIINSHLSNMEFIWPLKKFWDQFRSRSGPNPPINSDPAASG